MAIDAGLITEAVILRSGDGGLTWGREPLAGIRQRRPDRDPPRAGLEIHLGLILGAA